MQVALPIIDNQPSRPTFAQGPRSIQAVQLLRLSITDRCNFRCLYCMPEDGMAFSSRSDLLSASQIVAVASAAASLGVTHFKITGGEPTVRSDLLDIVRGIRQRDPVDLSMTTNGLLLTRLAAPLREAGLDRLTISLDTLRPDRFAAIARPQHGRPEELLQRVIDGIHAAEAAGFEHIKLNVVVMGGINDDEVADFARLTVDHPWTVRFIEYMPLGDATFAGLGQVDAVDNQQILAAIERDLGTLQPVDRRSEVGVGPAEVYQIPDARGRIGFISAMSQPFCETCNRLRLTAVGELRACLFDGGEVNILDYLRPEPDEAALMAAMSRCVSLKPDTHNRRGNRAMSQLGG